MNEAPAIEFFRNNLTELLGEAVSPSHIYPGTFNSIRTLKKSVRIKKKVGIPDNEIVLLYCDYGFFIKKYSLVLTDGGVYYLNYGTSQDIGKRKSFLWKDVIDIWIEQNAFQFSTPRDIHVIPLIDFSPLLATGDIEVLLNRLKQLVVVVQRGCVVMPQSTKKALYKNI